jgi:uncharacterized membrane protein
MKGDEDFEKAILLGLGIVLLLVVLSLPVKGTIAGFDLELPLIGWIGFAAFTVIALVLYFKHRA